MRECGNTNRHEGWTAIALSLTDFYIVIARSASDVAIYG
jgi:hypothetical protein